MTDIAHELATVAFKLAQELLRLVVKLFLPAAEDPLQRAGLLPPLIASRDVQQIHDKLTEAARALDEANQYASELQQNVAARRGALEQLQQEYDHYQSLTATEKAKAAEILAEVANTVNDGRIRERAWSFGLGLLGNIIVFILGVLFSDSVRHFWAVITGSAPR